MADFYLHFGAGVPPYYSYVSLAQSITPDNWESSWGYSFWIRTTDSNRLVFGQLPGATVSHISLTADGRIQLYMVGSAPDYKTNINIGSSMAINDGEWHHVVITSIYPNLCVYIDGEVASEIIDLLDYEDIPGSYAGIQAYIACKYPSGGRGFIGDLDDFRFCGDAGFTESNVIAMYNDGEGTKYTGNAEEGYVYYAWNMDEGEGDSIFDETDSVEGTFTGDVSFLSGGTLFPPISPPFIPNSKIDGNFYKNIAMSYSEIYSSLVSIENYSRLALDSIINITSMYDLETGLYSSARMCELLLLNPFNIAYLSSISLSQNLSNYISPLRELNKLVIKGSHLTDVTNQEKLDYFINNEVEWDNGCVPFGWYQLCYMAGYNVENWNVCS